jgi:TRAP-type C4-dicarboxylate transport system permease small subunit
VTEKAGDEPPLRPSQSMSEALGEPLRFPDDGVVAKWLRWFDSKLGLVENVALFAILATVVLTASTHAILEKATGKGLEWSFDIVRGGTFSVAMIGAAFATQQSRHLAMDLISRRLPPRGRLVLLAFLEMFTIAIAVLLMRSGFHQVDQVVNEPGEHLIEKKEITMFLPIGCALIIGHALLHLAIDVEYLVRNKLPPERARSGH